MKKQIIFVLALFILSSSIKAQDSFGQITYPHQTNEVLTSGAATNHTPGFLMAGYLPTSSFIDPNFYIDRTDMGGGITSGIQVFQKKYSIFKASTCDPPTRLFDCYGVSIVESGTADASTSNNYALAGTCSQGAFFAYLDATGNPVNTMFYPVSLQTGDYLTKPIIIKASTSITGQEEYFICFGYISLNNSSTIYLLRVTQFGTTVWSGIYLTGYPADPRAMMESPYGPQLVIAGKWNGKGFILAPSTLNGSPSGASFFIYSINSSSSVFSPIANGFSSIQVANSPTHGGAGFIIGGYAPPAVAGLAHPGHALFLKINAAGTPEWSTLVSPRSDHSAGDVVGVSERKNQANNYEYYGILNSQAGVVALKLDANGIPVSGGEFLYGSGTTATVTTGHNLDYFDNNTHDNGLHIFGTYSSSSPAGHYLTQAYFSGHSGCNTPVSVYSYLAPTISYVTSSLPLYGWNSTCSQFSLTAENASGHTAICGPYASLGAPASNARILPSTSGVGNQVAMSVYPNPVNDKTLITGYAEQNSTVKILLYDCLGHLVTAATNSVKDAGNFEYELDLKSLGVPGGVYFVEAAVNGTAYKQKIIFMNE